MRRKQLAALAAVAVLPLAIGVLPASAEEITGPLDYAPGTQTYSVDGTALGLTPAQLESTDFGDLDDDGTVETLVEELDGVLALDGDAPDVTAVVDDETGEVTEVTLATGGDAWFVEDPDTDDGFDEDPDTDDDGFDEDEDTDEQGTDRPDPDQLPEQASDTAVRVLTVISQWEGERGCEFGHAVARAAGGNPQGDCPEGGADEENGEDDGDTESTTAPAGATDTQDDRADRGERGRARAAEAQRGDDDRARGAAANRGKGNGQRGGGEAESRSDDDRDDGGRPERGGPPDGAGSSSGGGPPADAGPPSGRGGGR